MQKWSELASCIAIGSNYQTVAKIDLSVHQFGDRVSRVLAVAQTVHKEWEKDGSGAQYANILRL